MAAKADPNPITAGKVFEYEGDKYQFTFPWAAIVQFENATNSSLAQFQFQLMLMEQGGPWPKLHHIGEFMRAGLSEHHPDVDAETACAIWMDEASRKVALAVMNEASPKEGKAPEGEPSPPSNQSGGSKKSSGNGSKPAAKKKPSGKPRRG